MWYSKYLVSVSPRLHCNHQLHNGNADEECMQLLSLTKISQFPLLQGTIGLSPGHWLSSYSPGAILAAKPLPPAPSPTPTLLPLFFFYYFFYLHPNFLSFFRSLPLHFLETNTHYWSDQSATTFRVLPHLIDVSRTLSRTPSVAVETKSVRALRWLRGIVRRFALRVTRWVGFLCGGKKKGRDSSQKWVRGVGKRIYSE